MDVGWRLESIRKDRLKPNRFIELRLRMDAEEMSARCGNPDGGCPLGDSLECPFLGRECSDVDAYDWMALIRTTLDRNRKAGGKPYFLPASSVQKARSALRGIEGVLAGTAGREEAEQAASDLKAFLDEIEVFGQ